MKTFLVLFCCILTGLSHADASESGPGSYAVASAHPLATEAGLQILAKGGNAFDAAVAVSAALAVVEPYHSGLGGGGFWLLYDVKNKKNLLIDGRETAPMAAKKNMFLDMQGRPIQGLSLNGGLASAIPGSPAALDYISSHYGRLPLSKTLAPAIRLADEGFKVDPQFVYFSTMGDRLENLQKYPSTAAVFLNENQPYQVGDLLVQKDLARTLRLIAEQGSKGFYQGDVAEKLVKGNRDAGGVWTLDDLKAYKIIVREPLISAWHNMLVITAPPPSAGGVILITMLNILQGLPLNSFSDVEKVHYLTETMRLAYWQANQTLADPAFVSIPLQKLLSADNGKYLRSLILKDKALPSEKLGQGVTSEAHQHTTHFSILDKDGNRVSATMTVNYIFGSSVVPQGTGVLLNDEMDDFTSKPGQKNVFGLVGSDVNAIAPGKRPLSFMTPCFLEMPDRLAILGTPGGTRIPSMVFLASLVFFEYKGAISMVSAMRFHHQYLPDLLQFEPETFSPSLQEKLKAMGYHLMALTQYYGDMQAITWEKQTGVVTAASDPRHIGLAVVSGTDTSKQGYGVQH